MKHSSKTSAQLVVSACIENKVQRVVISPGSRNAPLIIEFNAYSAIQKYSIVDERSAAFFALGMAKELQEPVALVCSSGSALLNYYPAIAEAFYSKIPLLIISADRPKHLIDIGDGQTIRQENVFRNHIVATANLSENDTDNNVQLLTQIFSDSSLPKGPIHINVPFDEPLYETVVEPSIIFKNKTVKPQDSLLTEKPIPVADLEQYAKLWNQASKKMVLLGEAQPDEMLQIQLAHLSKDPSVIVLTETTSNVFHSKFINSIDQAIFPFDDVHFQSYKPDILLTFGGMIVSKKIKQLLRANPPKEHWHIDTQEAMDTYHCLTKHFKLSATLFFSQFFFLTKPMNSDYQMIWLQLKESRQQKHQEFLKQTPFCDLKVFEYINRHCNTVKRLQFSNSTAIRYAQLFSWPPSIVMGCNRGTSGIDGSVSTAIGVATASKEPTTLITGDLSFFYDANALWNRYIPSNFRIIVINNGGGGIFRFIPGPTTTNTLEYFEAPHQMSAKYLCEMHGVTYTSALEMSGLKEELSRFFEESDLPKLLEVFTPKELNAKLLQSYFATL